MCAPSEVESVKLVNEVTAVRLPDVPLHVTGPFESVAVSPETVKSKAQPFADVYVSPDDPEATKVTVEDPFCRPVPASQDSVTVSVKVQAAPVKSFKSTGGGDEDPEHAAVERMIPIARWRLSLLMATHDSIDPGEGEGIRRRDRPSASNGRATDGFASLDRAPLGPQLVCAAVRAARRHAMNLMAKHGSLVSSARSA